MNDTTIPKPPDPFDQVALASWLEDKPRELVVVFAVRTAIMALVGIASLRSYGNELRRNQSLVLNIFRGLALSFSFAKNPTSVTQDALKVVLSADVLHGPHSLSSGLFHALQAANATIAVDLLENENELAMSAARAAVQANSSHRIFRSNSGPEFDKGEDFASSLVEYEIQLFVLMYSSGLRRFDYLKPPVWRPSSDGTLQTDLQLQLYDLRAALSDLNGGWEIWADWAEARFRGWDDWPKGVYDTLVEWRDEWDRDPAKVNADIKALLEKYETDELGPRGPGAKLEYNGREVVFARSNALPKGEPRVEGLYGRCRELVNALITDNNPFPPSLEAGLQKLKTVLDTELADVPPIELFIAASAVLSKADAASIRLLNELSDRAVENLLELGRLLDPMMAFVLGDIEDARKKLRELRLEQETIRSLAHSAPRVLEIFQNLPVISAKVNASFIQSANVAATAIGQTESLWATGGILFQVKELAWVTNEHLVKDEDRKPLPPKNVDILRKLMSPEFQQRLKSNLNEAIDKSSDADKLSGHIDFGVRGGIASLGFALTWLSINYPLFMLAVPPLLMAMISRKLEKITKDERDKATSPGPTGGPMKQSPSETKG